MPSALHLDQTVVYSKKLHALANQTGIATTLTKNKPLSAYPTAPAAAMALGTGRVLLHLCPGGFLFSQLQYLKPR